MLEDQLVYYSAPILGGLKAGGLFGYRYSSKEELAEEIALVNASLAPKGVHVEAVKLDSRRALIYIWRTSMLEKLLRDPDVVALLRSIGYRDLTMDGAIRTLKQRLASCGSFPHEIGIFLGYPVDDVIEFVRQKGCNCKCCGFWKVYGDVERALRCFARYRKCIAIYRRLYTSGQRNLTQLTVCA